MFARFPFKPMNWILLWPKLECYGNYLIEEEDVQPLGAKICVSILFVAKQGIKLDRDVISLWCLFLTRSIQSPMRFDFLVRKFCFNKHSIGSMRIKVFGGQWFARFIKSILYWPWLWRSWQNSCFPHQISAVRFTATVIKYFESIYLSIVTQKRQK